MDQDLLDKQAETYHEYLGLNGVIFDDSIFTTSTKQGTVSNYDIITIQTIFILILLPGCNFIIIWYFTKITKRIDELKIINNTNN